MTGRVRETIRHYRMLVPGQRAGVAVSGGADSVCLLHVLRELAEWPLTVLHLNHGLRGEESRADAEFVRALADRLGLPFVLREAVLPPGNLEEAGREARRAFYRDAMATVDRVAVGHTRSDQAETVLFRFLRGSGTAGLAGILPVTAEGVVRPLIGIERPEILDFLRHRGLEWREDSSNAAPRFARNRIRRDLLPLLARDWNPAVATVLAHTADWAQAEEAYWSAEIARLAADRLVESDAAVLVQAAALRDLPLAAARRLVRYAIERARGDLRQIGFDHVDAVVTLALGRRGTGRVIVPGLEICRSFDWLRFGPPAAATEYEVTPVIPGIIPVPGTKLQISLELVENPENLDRKDCVYNKEMGCLDWGRLSGPLILRNWRAGDQYQPTKSAGNRKIKTLFQKARIPLWERDAWPVLADKDGIVWVRQFGPGARAAAAVASKVILRVGCRADV